MIVLINSYLLKIMKITDFRDRKYWNKFVDLKRLIKEFNQNEKDMQKYFALKNNWKTNSFDFKILKSKIIW